MLKQIAHRIVANPAVYDWVQTLAGAGEVKKRLAAHFARYASSRLYVLDVGAGTGFYRDVLPESSEYVCLDIDPQKVSGFVAKYPHEQALLADGTRMPISDGSVDIVLCTMVTHHIPDGLLSQFLPETARVLKSGGRFILVDPVWAPSRWIGRVLWKYDRGSYPRTAEALRSSIASSYSIEKCDRFAIHHEYMMCAAVKE